jgi:hypothetical protein
MKATKLLFVAALFSGLASFSFAGPGIDYWNRMTDAAKNRAAAEAKAKPEAPAMAKAEASAKAKPASEVVTSCATCECCAKKA